MGSHSPNSALETTWACDKGGRRGCTTPEGRCMHRGLGLGSSTSIA